MRYLRILMRALKDVLADKTRKRVSQQEVSVYCNELAQVIQKNYTPDLVVAIDTGGSVPGELIAHILSIPIVHLVVRRNITIARRYSGDPLPLRWIMSFYHHFLFQTVTPTIPVDIGIDVSGKKVLIVDDTMHTGATIDVVVNYLTQSGVLKIKIAALAYVSERKPDFTVLPSGNYSFPWSKDYIEHED